jgi:hypothetical protein
MEAENRGTWVGVRSHTPPRPVSETVRMLRGERHSRDVLNPACGFAPLASRRAARQGELSMQTATMITSRPEAYAGGKPAAAGPRGPSPAWRRCLVVAGLFELLQIPIRRDRHVRRQKFPRLWDRVSRVRALVSQQV